MAKIAGLLRFTKPAQLENAPMPIPTKKPKDRVLLALAATHMSDDAIIDKERCNNKCDCDGALRRQ
jgi:hypothetical protein